MQNKINENYKPEEKYIISESQEISLGEKAGNKFFEFFPAFKHRNYKLYFSGQLISIIGTWMQQVALGWLVLQLTNSAYFVGLIAAIGSLPALVFTLFGGVIVDRFPKKKIIIFTQIVEMILAFILGFLTVFNIINVPEIIILSFVLGVVSALDIPARQAFVIEMVGKEGLTSAISLNSAIYNSGRVIGPAIAGIAIVFFGIGGAFIFNGISFVAVLIALILIKVSENLPKTNPRPIDAIKEGIKYSFSQSTIKLLLIFTAITSIFGWSYGTMMPVIVQNIYHFGADKLGLFYSVTGLGALFSIILISQISKVINSVTIIIFSSLIFSISLILFSISTNLISTYLFLFLIGVGLITTFSMINTTIQHCVIDNMRGRVMSIYALMFMGMTTVGSFEVGVVADKFGPLFAIRFGSLITIIAALYLYSKRDQIRIIN